MTGKTERRRERLMQEQGGLCFYCERAVGTGSKELLPIVEHYVPRALGGRGHGAKLVLACKFCDTAKGLIPGPQFLALVRRQTQGVPFDRARPIIKRLAKAQNIAIQAAVRDGRFSRNDIGRGFVHLPDDDSVAA